MTTDRENSAAISSVLLGFMENRCVEEIKAQLKRKSMRPYQLKCDEVSMVLAELDKGDLTRSIHSVLYEIVSLTPVDEILNRLASKVKGEVRTNKSNILIEEYIKAGAGNILMKDLFGYGSKRCQRERKNLNIEYFTGRHKKLDEEQELDVLNTYLSNELNESDDLRRVVYFIYKATNYNINAIYNCLVEYKNIEKEKQAKKREGKHERSGIRI